MRGERRRVVVLEVRSVVRTIFALSLSMWAVAGVTLVALYIVGAVAGGLGGFRGLLASFGLTGAWASPVTFVPIFGVVAVVASAVTSAVAAVVALLYNALVPLVGGIEYRER